jgi:HK97 family phage major capsid protein
VNKTLQKKGTETAQFNKIFELKKSDSTNIYIFEGIATEYDSIDKTGEIIKYGAFDEELGKVIDIQVMHEGTRSIIGYGVLEQQDNKIIVRGELDHENPLARTIAKNKFAGVQYNLSIGGYRKEWHWEGDSLIMTKGVINETSFTGRDQQAHPAAIVTKTIEKIKEEYNIMDFTKEQMVEMAKAVAIEMNKAEDGKLKETEIETLKKTVKDLSDKLEKTEEKDKKFEGLQEIVKNMDKVINELSAPGETGQFNKADERKEAEAFEKYLVTGDVKEYKKVLNTTAGGALIPQLLASEIIKDVREISPFFADAKMYSGSRGSIDIPVRANWTNAVETVAEGSGVVAKGGTTYSLLNIKATKLQSEVELTDEMREDTDFDMNAEIREMNGEDFGATLSTRIVGGTYATDGFEGFTINSTVTAAALETAVASTLGVDDVIDLEFQVKPQYRVGAKYYASSKAVQTMKKFKDENGQFLWQNPITLGTPASFNGYPVVECTDMDDLSDGNYPVLFANFQKFYGTYMRKGMETEMDRLASEGIWNHITRMRVGGRVRQAIAGSLLKIKAT